VNIFLAGQFFCGGYAVKKIDYLFTVVICLSNSLSYARGDVGNGKDLIEFLKMQTLR